MDYTKQIFNEYEEMKSKRSSWESLWNECYQYALPQREEGGVIGNAIEF